LGRAGFVIAAAGMLLPLGAAARGDPPPARTVLVLVAEAAGVDDRAVVTAFQASVRERWPSRLNVYVEDLDPSRFTAERYQRDVSDYLRAKHHGRVDLLVVLSRPALEFILPNRASLFPGVPILFAGSGETSESLQQAAVTGIVVETQPARTIALARQLHPDAKQVIVVGGSRSVDRLSEQRAQRELAPLARQMGVTFLVDLPFSEVIHRLEAQPPDSIVLYMRFTRDATGAALAPREALQLIRQAIRAPIYGCGKSYLGAGLTGGVLVDEPAIGRSLGSLASRILAGESAASIRPVLAETVTAFDARELRRFGVDERQLPPGAVVEFRERTLLQRFSGHIPYFVMIIAGVSVLATSLFIQRRARQRVQHVLNERLVFEKNLADVSTTFIRLPAREIDTTMRGEMRRMLAAAHANYAAIYDTTDTSDRPWKARFIEGRQGSDVPPFPDWNTEQTPWLVSRLRAGQVLTFFEGESREQLVTSPPGAALPDAAAAVVVPLAVGPAMLGVLWCIWQRAPRPPLKREVVIERFRLLGEVFANALRRSQVEAALAETSDLNAAILASLIVHVAVLDRAGAIIAVNEAWMAFGRGNSIASEAAISPGINYLEVVGNAAEEGAPLAREALDGIRAVCEGRLDLFTLEYECSSPSEQRWFIMTVAALRRKDGGAVVTHRDITESKKIETAIRDSEARFRLLADALPVGVWMSDADARRIYFNRAWLDFTGRSLDRLLGDGWTYTLHPDDRQRYLDACQSAFAAREPFSIEYRIRRHDGRYGWFIDNAVPRYGADGGFHGFLGGCLDLTDRKEAEDALRDLTGRVITAEEEDRRRISRELHDGVNQLVALLAIEIEQLQTTPIRSQAELAQRAQALWNLTTEISTELHQLSHRLHPARLETFGLVPALQGYCSEITQQHHVRVAFSHHDVPASIPPEIALCVFRIVQEALWNVVKHSGASDATVELSGDPSRLSLRVSDAGRGFDSTAKHAGLGLVSMRERVRFARGTLTIASRPGEGTRIEVELPLHVVAQEVA